MKLADSIAELVLSGFNTHFKLFQQITTQAKQRFAIGDWVAVQKASSERITFYDKRVRETVAKVEQELEISDADDTLLKAVKESYLQRLQFHPQAELAETFYNSIFCRLFHRDYFNNENIFVETTLATDIPVPKESVYASLFPAIEGMHSCVRNMLNSFDFGLPFCTLERDVDAIITTFQTQTDFGKYAAHEVRLDYLKAPFYRNKAAYIVGRVVTNEQSQPFIIPIINNEQGSVYADAILTDKNQVSIVFGYSRAYFMVEAQAPSAVVHFLKELLPHKTLCELYSSIGFHKQGKTEFYRELLEHLGNSEDLFCVAPGIKGMVMEVFTLPSFPYVFKVIKDKFAPSKDFGRQTVKDRYFLVKKHDRVGRMADTLEYSHVALPKNRFSAELLSQLLETIPGSLELEEEKIIIKHLYIERRMTPLNIFLEDSNDEDTEFVMRDYGKALKDMVAANIFPGDMLLKNFGVTRHKRVVFYDYDEVQYLLDMTFRKIPPAPTYEDELSSEPWYSVSPGDVFPEQIATFVTTQKRIRDFFLKHHSDLLDADYWKQKQDNIRNGIIEDVYPYPRAQKFRIND